MAQTAYYDTVTLDVGSKRRAADSTLIVRGRFARTGVQTYDNGDGTTRAEYRSEEEVQRSASSFEGLTVTDLHPSVGGGMVTPARWRELARGHLQDAVFVDGWLEGDFYIPDTELAARVEDGSRRELSAGYFTTPVADVGTAPDGTPYELRQTAIIGNHVAALPAGAARAGREARLLFDSIAAAMPHDAADEEGRLMDEIKITIGGITYMVKADSSAGQALTQELARIPALEAERDQAQAKADAASEAEVKATKALADATDPAKLSELVLARADLVAKATKLAGRPFTGEPGEGPKLDGLTDTQIRSAALKLAGRDVDGRSDAYVEAAFDLALEAASVMDEADGPLVRDALAGAQAATGEAAGNLAVLWDARDRYLKKEDRHGDLA